MFDFRRLAKPAPIRAAPRVPGGALVWAIGDVHGRDDLLGPLLEHILDDFRSSACEAPVLIGLGDYVDRGPNSRAVIDRLLEVQMSGVDCIFLMGNHEEALLTFLSEPQMGPSWAQFGGRETLWSYGVSPPTSAADAEAWRMTASAFADALPAGHLAFLQALALSQEIGDYIFVHAGVRPGLPMESQSRQDLLWIRHAFLDHRGPFPKVVVHGHTPMERVVVTPYRIGVDTGAYATSRLSAVRLVNETRQVALAHMAGGMVTVDRMTL